MSELTIVDGDVFDAEGNRVLSVDASCPMNVETVTELVRRANALYELVSSVAKVHGERHSRGCVCCYCQKINEVLTDCVLRDCEVTP